MKCMEMPLRRASSRSVRAAQLQAADSSRPSRCARRCRSHHLAGCWARAGAYQHSASRQAALRSQRPRAHRQAFAAGRKETVVVTGHCPGALGAYPGCRAINGPGDGCKARRCCAQTPDLLIALGAEHRSRCSTACARRRQQRPQGRQQARLMAASCATSPRRSQRTSGWRRTMPEAVQGASSRWRRTRLAAAVAWPPVLRGVRHRPPAPAPAGPGAAGCRGCARRAADPPPAP